MQSILLYIFKVILCSGCLYGYYLLFLKNKKLHFFNRLYLLGSLGLSVVIPFLRIPVALERETHSNPIMQSLISYPKMVLPEVLVFSNSHSAVNEWAWLQIVYGIIVGIGLLKLGHGIFQIMRLRHRNPIQRWCTITIIETDNSSAPFSFFNWLFWNPVIGGNQEIENKIFRHERFHIHQGHSYDIIFAELICRMGWINPFFWQMKNELKTVHEFSADAYASRDEEPLAYAATLVAACIAHKKQPFVNPFFHNQLKRRIMMLSKKSTQKYIHLQPLWLLPLLGTMVFFLVVGCNSSDQRQTSTAIPSVSQPPAILADSGEASTPMAPAMQQSETTQMERVSTQIQNNKAPTSTSPASSKMDEPEIYVKVAHPVSFPGGHEAWKNFLFKNLRASTPVDMGAPAGTYTAMVQFVVDRAGSLSDIKVIKDPGYGVGAEAVRVIRSSGKWKPASLADGRIVKSYCKQPITFMVQEN